MNCTEFHNRIEEMRPEESRFADPGLWEHLVYCSSCREVWESQSVVLEATHAWMEQSLPDVDLADRVLQELSRESLSRTSLSVPLPTTEEDGNSVPNFVWQPSPKRSVLSRSFAAASALVLTAVMALFVFNDAPKPSLPQDVTAASSKRDIPHNGITGSEMSTPATQPAIDDLVRDAGSAYLMLAQETAGAVSDVSLLISSSEPNASGLELGSLGVESPTDWMGIWKEKVTPPPDSVWSALDFLWKDLPAKSESAT